MIRERRLGCQIWGILVWITVAQIAYTRAQQTVIHCGRMIDVGKGKVSTTVDILIDGNRIVDVGRNLKPSLPFRENLTRRSTQIPTYLLLWWTAKLSSGNGDIQPREQTFLMSA